MENLLLALLIWLIVYYFSSNLWFKVDKIQNTLDTKIINNSFTS